MVDVVVAVGRKTCSGNLINKILIQISIYLYRTMRCLIEKNLYAHKVHLRGNRNERFRFNTVKEMQENTTLVQFYEKNIYIYDIV